MCLCTQGPPWADDWLSDTAIWWVLWRAVRHQHWGVGQLSPSCEKTQAHMHCCMTSIESSDSQDVLLWSACMSVVCITCLYSYMRHSCLCTCGGVASKAFSRGEGWGCSQPTFMHYTCTYNHREITNKREWMCTCGTLLSHVRTYIHHLLRLPNTTFM